MQSPGQYIAKAFQGLVQRSRVLPPKFIVTAEDDRWCGYIVIDSLVNNTSSGGLRIASDIDISEVQLLSREMTLKFSFIGLSRGGAKSGVRMPQDATREDKHRMLENFGQRIAVLIRSGIYYPGMDMNCGEDDLRAVYRGAGLNLGKTTDSSYFTALSVENSIIACSKTAAGGKRPLTIAIEGFGSVAAHLASRLDPSQFRIIALSTVCGGVEKSRGFSPDELIENRRRHMDNLVEHLEDARRVDQRQVIYSDADILVPSARTLSIRAADADAIRSRFIVPAANAPYAEGVIERLHQRGIICLPGFAVNCGGVFASSLLDSGVSIPRIQDLCSTLYRDVISSLLEKSRTQCQSPVKTAEGIALTRQAARSRGIKDERRARLVKKAFQKGLIPKKLYGRYYEGHFSRNLRDLNAEIDRCPTNPQGTT